MEITVYEESALLEISNFLTEYLSKNGDFKKLVAQLNKMIFTANGPKLIEPTKDKSETHVKPQYIELAAQVNIRTICKCEVTLMTTEQFKLYQHFLSKGIDLDDYTLSIVNELVQNKPVETIAKNLEDKTQVEWKKWLKVILEVLSALALIKELFFSHTQPANSYEITNNYNITETVNINLGTNSDLEKTDSSINNTVNEKE